MSSTRPTRKSSRRSSPHRNTGDSPSSAAADTEKKEKKTFLEKWVEPPLRPPAPSFEDHKGLERHGVLEYMAPLGTLPSAKVKARVKTEPPRRVTQVKNGDPSVLKDRPSTPETTIPALGTRRSESRKVEDRAPRTPLPRQQLSEKSVTSASKASTRSSGKGANAQSSSQEASTPLTPHRKERLKEIVEQAHNRAVEVGQPEIGFALKQHYEDSLRDSNLADQLEAVLYKTSTPDQTAGFQAYIKKAKKLYKAQPAITNGTRRFSELGAANSFTSASKSPSKGTRSGAASGTRNNVSKLEATEPKASKISDSLKKETKSKGKQAERNAMSGKDDYVLTRSKSSSSSLSSLSSSLDENFAPPSMEGDHANAAETPAASPPMNNSKSKTSLGPKLHTFPTSSIPTDINGRKRSSSSAGLTQDDLDAALHAKRQRVSRSFDDVEIQESDTRCSSAIREPLPNQSSALKSQVLLPVFAYPTRLRDGTARKRFLRDDEEDAVSSPTSIPGDLSAPGGASTGGPSRPSTPSIFGPFSKKSKKAARIKMSPFKKKSGVIAGIARERNSPVGYGGMPDYREDENDDVCSACGGQGTLLCCDGCTSSFHFTCVDPPMEQEDLKDDEAWYCCICIARRDPPHRQPRGIFASLLDNLEKKNPMSFNLPKDLREYFEGVKTGDEGEYEEAVTQKSRTRGGYEEEPDLLKLKDTKGKVVLCFRCGKSAINGQKIIPCDFCSLHWHLDCLDPPLANPPPRAPNGKPKHNWMCPNHVDHELLAVDPSVKAYGRLQSCNGGLRTHKVRKPKNARILDTHLRRGFANNGLIEIENDPSDDEESQFFQQNHFGIIYRLPERGIKLDFISKIRSMREKEARAQQTQTHSSASSQAPEPTHRHPGSTYGSEIVQQDVDAADAQLQREFGKKSAAEQSAAVNLVHFALLNADLDVSPDKIGVLVDMLIAEAPPEVKAMFGEGGSKNPMIPPSPPSSDSRPDQLEGVLPVSIEERNTLLMLQELIRRRLESAPTIG